MEIGHNVLHGQWDWMRDPKINSSTWEWDHTSPARHWQRTHNQTHHKFTNIVGQDNDLGWGIMRVDESQPWQPRHLAQPFVNLVTACIFEWGITTYDLDLGVTLQRQGQPVPGDPDPAARGPAQGRPAAGEGLPDLPGPVRSGIPAHAGGRTRRPAWSATCGATR